jgi:2-hydroxy-6-oxonona-2,4-dienedioate hydrolase
VTLWTELIQTPHELRYVDAGGVRTRALVAGRGEPVVFLHGVSGHLETYIPTLGAHAEHFEVHAIDMLGHGYSEKPPGAYTIATYAEHVIAYLDAAGIEAAHISGLSLGGWITAHIARVYPDRVRSATLTCSAGSPAMADPKMAALIRKMTADAITNDDRSLTRARMEMLFSQTSRLTEEIVDIRYSIYHQPDLRAALEGILALTDLDLYRQWMLTAERLAQIDTEVLIIASEEDVVSEVQGASTFVENIPRNKLVVFPDCGHWPPFERADLFSTYSVAFLQGGLGAVPAELTRTLERDPVGVQADGD